MAGPWEKYSSPDVQTDQLKGPWEKYGAPTEAKTETPEQKTDKIGTIEKGVRAASYGLLGGAEGAMNTIGKAIGADPQKLAKVNMLINAGREAMGVTPEEYAPASAGAMNPKASFGERMSYMPRALIEMGAPMAAGAALGGLPGALGTVGVTEAGPTIDRVREADKTDPNAELTPGQKARVAGKVGLDMLLTGVGGRATLGATAPIRDVGMAGVKQAVGNVVKAGATDAVVGGGSAAADKALVEKEAPSFNDVAVPALTGAIIGAGAHAPGAARETAVSVRNRALGDLDPQSRGAVADVIQRYDGDFKATQKHLEHELTQATKGLDDLTKDQIAKAKIKHDAGQRIDPETIQSVSATDPVAGRALADLDTFGVMKSLDNGGVSNSFIGRILNPFERTTHDTSGDRFASAIGRAGQYASIGHSMWSHSPETALGVFGTQLAGTGLLHGIDRFTGAANPGKVITDKFAGTVEPMPSVAQARAAGFASDQSSRADKAAAAREELRAAREAKANTEFELGIGNVATRNVQNTAKQRQRESDQLWKEASASVRALNKRDDLQSGYDSGVSRSQAEQDRQLARQADIMRRSQAVEDRRLAAEDRAATSSSRQAWRDAADSVRALANREAIQARGPAGRGQDMGVQSNVPLPELVSSDATAAIRAARLKQVLEKQATTAETARQNKLMADLKRQLELRQNSESASASSADLALRVAKLKASYEAEAARAAEAGMGEATPEPTFSSLAGTETGKLLEQARATERFNKRNEKAAEAESKKSKKATEDAALAKAEKKVKDAEGKAKEAEKDAKPNMYVFEHRGQKARVDKSLVKSPKRYEESFKRHTDTRMDVLDEAKDLTKDKKTHKYLDQLAKSWTDATNDPAQARKALDRILNDNSIPEKVREHLDENWYRVVHTWETIQRGDE